MSWIKTLEEIEASATEEVMGGNLGSDISRLIERSIQIDPEDVAMLMILSWKRGYSAAVEDANKQVEEGP